MSSLSVLEFVKRDRSKRGYFLESTTTVSFTSFCH